MITIGKLLNSLQYNIDKNIEDTLYKNKTFLTSKWNIFEYNILRWSQRHSYYIILAVILACLLVVNLLIWKEQITPLTTEYFPHWKRLIDWQGGFLAGQLTIVGVVYPLVIGLIGVLFQNKSAKKTLLPIYQMYSGFMFAGLSGLFLSVFIVLGYFLSANMEDSTYLAICVTTALWLMFNVLLTSWFFTTTFLMLDEAKRDRLVVRYTIHELCETDIRHRIRDLMLLNAVQHRFLANPEEKVLKVSTYKFSDDKYNEIVITSESKIYITNVYFSIINFVIRYHLWKIKKIHWLKTKKLGQLIISRFGFRRLNADSNTTAEIVFQPVWSKDNVSGLVIVRYAGFDIGWLSKAIIKASFATKKTGDNYDKSLTSMMQGSVGSANDAIREKNITEFKYALDNIVKWHLEIASALSFLDEKKEEDNWLLLPTSNFFSRSYMDEVLTEYYRLAKSAVELIPENIEFFDEIIYLHKRIFTRREKLVKREGFSLIQGSYFTWLLLMEWRSYSSSSLDMRVSNKYEDVLFDFVGSWESWLDYIEPRSKRLNDLQNSLPLFLTHLEFTAHTAIAALRYNNVEAAGWGVDMLNNWVDKLSVREHGHGVDEYRWHSELITHDMLLKSRDDPAWITVLNGYDFNLQSAFSISVNNAAFDLRVITACYILLKPNLNDHELIRQYISSLLTCASIHHTGSSIGRRAKSIRNASDILGAYIRHRDYPNYGEGSYGSWLSKTLESFGRVNEQRMVSGRIYSGWGRNDPQSMNSAYVEIAVSLSDNKWQLDRKWFDVIFSHAFRHEDQESLVRELQNWIELSDKISDSIIITSGELKNKINNFKISIENTINQISQRQSEILADAELDDALLISFGLICSKAITGEDKDLEFPIGLFKSVSFNSEIDNNNLLRLNIQKYSKADVAKNISTSRAINEDDWLKELTKQSVEANVFNRILHYKITDSKTYSTAENNLLEIHELGKAISNPILFSGDSELKDFLYQARYQKDLAGKFDISFIDGYGGNYLCHIGDVIVYSIHFSNVNFSLLMSEDIFESINFGKIADNQYVSVEYLPSDKNENIGALSISYWMSTMLAEGFPCIKTKIL